MIVCVRINNYLPTSRGSIVIKCPQHGTPMTIVHQNLPQHIHGFGHSKAVRPQPSASHCTQTLLSAKNAEMKNPKEDAQKSITCFVINNAKAIIVQCERD